MPVCESSSDAGGEVEGLVDTHFARLLSSLTLSAKEVPFDMASSSSPAASSTPTPADSPVKASQSSSPSLSAPASNDDAGPQRTDGELQHSLTSPPSVTGPSVSSNTLGHTSPPLPSLLEIHGHLPIQDTTRRLKHLALLESVANELLGAPSQSLRHSGQPALIHRATAFQVPPHPPSSVPPPFIPVDQRFLSSNNAPVRQAIPPQGYRNFVNPPIHLPNYNDPIQGRPLTSNAILPPPLAQRRLMHHGSAMSLHQGNLLTILGSNAMPGRVPSTGVPAQVFDSSHALLGNFVPPHPTLSNAPSQNGRLHGVHSLAVHPPSARTVQNGPLTAPLMMQSQQPTMNNIIYSTGPRHTPPNKAQLLSILTPNIAVRPAVHPAGYPAVGM